MDKKGLVDYYDKLSGDKKGLKVIRSDFDLLKHHTEVKIAFGAMKKGSSLLDIGCGEGFDLISFKEKDMYPVGLDISIGMLKRCRRKTRASLSLVCADAEQMPFKNNSFDAVHSREISFFNSCNVNNIIKHLNEVRRVLKKGGTIMLMLPTKDYEGSKFKPYCEEEIMYLYRKSGFKDIDFVYPMNSKFLKISRRFYKWFTKLLSGRSFFIIGLGIK